MSGSFHFLRPEWLLALLGLLPLLWLARRRLQASAGWERVCDAQLLSHLLKRADGTTSRWPLVLLAAAWISSCLAMAGPTWERLPQPAFQEPTRTVFVLSLSPSMDERDVAPSRLARARHKLLDALDRLSGGSMALIVYREEAHAITPLTDDAAVLRELVPLLETRLAPGRGVNPARGIEEAEKLLEPVGLAGARILLITDGTDSDAAATRAAARAAAAKGVRVSVLGVAGDAQALSALARSGAGAYSALSADDRDLASVLGNPSDAVPLGTLLARSQVKTDEWRDVGAWLVWLPVLLAPLAFRKGWAAAALALLWIQFAGAPAAQADFLDDWFLRPDQRGAQAFAEKRYEESAADFEHPGWRAAARYRAGDYEAAAESLKGLSDATSLYNRGNALAKSGQLEQALKAYDQALAERPDDEDAHFNRDLVERLLQQQQKQQQQQQSGSGADQQDGKQSASQQDQAGQQSDGQKQDQGDQGEGQKQDQAGQQGQPQDARQSGQADQQAGEQQGEQGQEQAQQQPQQQAGKQAGEQGQQQAGQSDASGAEERKPDAGGASDPGQQRAGPQQAGPPGASGQTPISPEDQRMEQWMARLPDDPGGLLREKIRRDYLRKRAARLQEDQP